MTFSSVDILIVLVYLFGIAGWGILSGGRQSSARDYFLSEHAVPWWAVCFAIVATETSALTFLSVPGLAYVGSFHFLQIAFGYLVGRILIAVLFIPAYFGGELSTAYAYLERRFGARLRRSASVIFMGTRTLADGVRLYTTAIPLALILKGMGFPVGDQTTFYVLSIVLLSLLTTAYVLAGGVRAVIWTDVVQMIIYFVGAIAALAVLLEAIPLDLSTLLLMGQQSGKLEIVHVGMHEGWGAFWGSPYTLAGSLLGGMFLSMASHGADHLIVQRVLATQSVSPARKAMVMSGVIVIVQFVLFLSIGYLLSVFYPDGAISPNEVFANFIISRIPSGLSGLIVAGLLAAAMSTLSGSISALSATTMMDLVHPLSRRPFDEARSLAWSRRIALLWTLVITIVACGFIATPHSVVELALSIASYTYGGLLGVFLLGLLTSRPGEGAALAGFIAALVVMTVVILFVPVAWTWYTLIGSMTCILVGIGHARVFPSGIRRTG